MEKKVFEKYFSYGFTNMEEAIAEEESDGGWTRHCQVRAATIVLNYSFKTTREMKKVYDRYYAHLVFYGDGWEKFWHYGKDTKAFIGEMVEKWKKMPPLKLKDIHERNQ
jgi:hypothetical protein